MVNVERLQRGIRAYVDNEMLPKMTGAQRWMTAVAVGIYTEKLPQMLGNYAESPSIKPLGVITPDGVDVETAYKYLKPAAQAGGATFNVPVLGAVTFTEADVDHLYQYIMQQ